MPTQAHHIFLSYARADNVSGRITAFADRLRSGYLTTTGHQLRIFMDIHHIEGGAHWHDEILRNLHDAHILLACLSPNYLASEYCQKEFNEFMKGETGHALF